MVVKYAAENSNRAAERKFGVSEKLVRDWRKAEVTLTAMKKTKKACLSTRARTTVCQKLPADFQAKVDSFREFGEKQVTEHNMPPDHIINMDEVPLTFELNYLKLGQNACIHIN